MIYAHILFRLNPKGALKGRVLGLFTLTLFVFFVFFVFFFVLIGFLWQLSLGVPLLDEFGQESFGSVEQQAEFVNPVNNFVDFWLPSTVDLVYGLLQCFTLQIDPMPQRILLEAQALTPRLVGHQQLD